MDNKPKRDSKGRFLPKEKTIVPSLNKNDDKELDENLNSETETLKEEVVEEQKTPVFKPTLVKSIETVAEPVEVIEDEKVPETIEFVETSTKDFETSVEEESRMLKALGKTEEKNCPVDKTVPHENDRINAIKMKIGVRPTEGKGTYAKGELAYLIWDLIYTKGFNDPKNQDEYERTWKYIGENGIKCSKTQFKERWATYFELDVKEISFK